MVISYIRDGMELDLSVSGIRILYRGLIMGGYTPAESGNLIGHLLGLSVVQTSWTLKQILDIEFLKSQTSKLH